MLDITPRYLKKEEYLKIKGINLDVELPEDDDPANASNRFIYRVEEKVINFLAVNYRVDVEVDVIDKNMNMFKLAIIEQIENDITNGKHSEICDNAKFYLRRAGLMNIKLGRPLKSGNIKRWY